MMKTKIFKIRIDEDYLYRDQEKLDAFLSDKEILSSKTAFVPEGCFWSVLFFFEEKSLSHNQSVIQESNELKYPSDEVFLTDNEEKILMALKLWRADRAKEQNIPMYCIASNKELMMVAKNKPHKKVDLQSIKGFGKHKVESYGQEIINLLENLSVLY